jgi:hypothetical protein
MTPTQVNAMSNAFCRRRPFRAFLIEFVSGSQILVGHPEVVRQESNMYVARLTNGGFVTFSADSVARLFDTQLTS